jgi:hypothetical protein
MMNDDFLYEGLTREERLRRQGKTKILPISEEWVMTDFLNRVMGQPLPDYSTVLADNKQVPPDVVIGRVHHNVFQRTIEFQVFHETFEAVPERQEIPRLYPMKMMSHVSQLSGKVSLSVEHILSPKELDILMNGSRKDFALAADIEANTSITVGMTSDKIANTTQWATDRGIATFFSPSGPMADDVSECVDRCKQELAKHHPQAVKVMHDLFNEEVQEPAVVEEKKVNFREWL